MTMKDGVKEAIENHDLDGFRLWVDTFESTIEDETQLKKPCI
ncbi:hypothetical protein [Streptohalobacillus salinus]|nr:hypothetical protein [Streptohalobacillus salinus]